MAVDPVPLNIGQGAVHTDDTFRVGWNAATRDSQGVILPGQMKVTALGTPGAAVSVAAGGVVIRNAQSSGQSYIGRGSTATQVSIAPNNGGSVRRDLVMARIIDPDFSPWQPSGSPGAPNTSVANGPYFQLYVESGVASGTIRASQVVSYAAVELARIDMPAGAQTVLGSYIVDLRELAQPRNGFAYDVQAPPTASDFITTAETSWTDWPVVSLQVKVPRWATHAQVAIRYAGIAVDGAGDVDTRVNMAGVGGPATHFDYNGNAGTGAGFVEILPWMAYGEFVVTAVQDSTVTVKPQGMRVFPANAGNIWVDGRQLIEFDVKFSERVV
jgi:hypothetical protein